LFQGAWWMIASIEPTTLSLPAEPDPNRKFD
jgi:hypothetical protein